MPSSTTDLIKSKLDIVEFIRGYVQLTPAGKNFRGLCPFHKEKSPSFMVSPDRQSWHCFGCFPPGQKVKTPFGYHNIETIDKNHFVYSGKGEIKKVITPLERNYTGELVDVSVRKLGGVVSLTTDHRLRAVRPNSNHPKRTKWFYQKSRDFMTRNNVNSFAATQRYASVSEISAGELRVGDFVLYPIQRRIRNLSHLNLEEYLSKTSKLGPRPPKLSYHQPLNDAFLKLMGYWIAEGSNHRAYIRFSLGNHEEDFAAEIITLTKELFNLDAKIYRRPAGGKRTGIEITACHSLLANIFENLCGSGAAYKHIPFVLQELDPVQQKIIVDAIWQGDGTSYIANRSTKEHKSIGTVSRILAEQIVDILLRNKIFPSLQIQKEKIDKLGVHHQESYTVKWSEEAESQHKFVYHDEDGVDYWLLPVKSVFRRPYTGPVYNLNVDDDHSYIAGNFAVSNCGLGGSVFDFVMKYDNVEFGEALRILAERAGVELKRENPAEYRYSGLLYDLNDAAKNYFRRAFAAAPVAREYLTKRGLSQATIDEFEIGWAPNEPEGLSMYLLNSGTSPQDLIQSGLSFKTERGLMLDRFRGRIMFPIHNHTGKVVGFTGRILPQLDRGDMGKYVNSPETPIFQKSRLLYGFWKSKEAIRETHTAFLVEGQMDFLMSYQSGMKNVIASSGTALTADHLRVVRRLAENVIISFDSDTAGSDAAERGIDLAEQQDFAVRVATFAEFKDAADAALADPKNIQKVVDAAVPAMEFYFSKFLTKDPATREGLNGLRMVLAKLKNLSSPVERDHWMKELSKRTGIKDKTLEEEMAKAMGPAFAATSAGGSARTTDNKNSEIAKREVSRQDRIAEDLLAAALASGNFAVLDESITFFNPIQKEMLRLLAAGKKQSEDPSLDAAISIIVFRSSDELSAAEIAVLKSELAKEYYKERRKTLAQAIKNAEAHGNETELAAALEEMRGLPGTGE